MNSSLHHQDIWKLLANGPVTSKTPSSLATLDLQFLSSPWIPNPTIVTSSQSSNGDLFGIALPDSSLPNDSDPKSRNTAVSNSTLVASERSPADTIEQVPANAEMPLPQTDYLSSQHTINQSIDRVLYDQHPISSISMEEFIAICLHERQAGQQIKINDLWELVPSNMSNTRFDLYFNKTKIQGIQMESFKTEPDTNASDRKGCAYDCKSSTRKHRWFAGIKYVEYLCNLGA
jgi:hypothetical protein